MMTFAANFGPLLRKVAVSLRQVTDGTLSTMIVGEQSEFMKSDLAVFVELNVFEIESMGLHACPKSLR